MVRTRVTRAQAHRRAHARTHTLTHARARAQLWSPQQPAPVATIDTGANVCSVRFCPWAGHLLAAGSAAHTALVYDVRMLPRPGRGGSGGGAGLGVGAGAVLAGAQEAGSPCPGGGGSGGGAAGEWPGGGAGALAAGVRGASPVSGPAGVGPVASFSGHRRAVAYVRWAGPHELLTASTDSTLRLWDVRGGGCGSAGGGQAAAGQGEGAGWAGQGPHAPVCTYAGHTNERSFVGLSAAGSYIACGSETGEVRAARVCAHACLPSRQRLPACALHACTPPWLCARVCWRARRLPPTHGAHRARAWAPLCGRAVLPPRAQVVIYLKHMGTPCIRHRLTPAHVPAALQPAPGPAPQPFVSAVTWRQRSQTLAAANSQGHLWVCALHE